MLLLVSAAVAALSMCALAAGADPTGGANNIVLVSTTADGSTLARASTQLVSAAGGTVTSANIADSTSADCTGCHSTAVAVQVLLVTGNPSYLAPANVAAAVNAGCTGCGSYAYAWQYVLQTSGPVHLSPAAQLRVAQLRQEISDASASILPSDALTDPCFTLSGPPYPCETRDQQLDAKLDTLTDELKSVVDSGVHAAGVTATGVVERDIQGSPGS